MLARKEFAVMEEKKMSRCLRGSEECHGRKGEERTESYPSLSSQLKGI